MTVLQALCGYYDRMEARGEAEPPGYSREKIGFALVLNADGEVIDREDLREQSGRKLAPRLLEVPAAVKRTAGISPNLLWDKSAYVLGRTAGEGRRTAEEHAAFRQRHLDLLDGTDDPGLAALRRFLERWTPGRFDAPPFVADMLDANLVFRLDGDRVFVHARPAARALVAASAGSEQTPRLCLVTGHLSPPVRLHPVIKGVPGAQSSGAALVSFNLDAFASYGHEQGDNAPTSEAAAFRYGAALNRMLDRGSANRLPRPVGDTTIVFWADASGADTAAEAAARAAEDAFAAVFDPLPPPDDPAADVPQTAALREAMQHLAEGRPAEALFPRIDPGVRFHVLGLAPNAARLSVRFWVSDSFARFADALGAHYRDLAIDPPPWRATPPSVARLLVKTTAAQEKFDNIPPLLAGEVLRAILTGAPYPRSLFAATIMRLRAGDDAASGWHAAVLRAVLAREARLHRKEEPPVSLNRDCPNAAYQLGRMFALLEAAQRMALGTKVNATIRDRYFGAASATPASVFPLLLRGVQNHLAKLRKEGKGGWIEKEMEQIADNLPPSLPRALRLEDQGRFAIGYYHQRRGKVAGKVVAEAIEQESAGEGDNDEQ
jgi:CRISPR-associated protein Csd1